eukprot:6034521-Lingulodinium_polyedra.AAC.1
MAGRTCRTRVCESPPFITPFGSAGKVSTTSVEFPGAQLRSARERPAVQAAWRRSCAGPVSCCGMAWFRCPSE